MTIIDTIQTTAAASGQPLNLAHLDVLRTVLLANSPMGQSLSEAALRMWRGDQALISHRRTTLQPLWFALLDLPRQDEEDAPCPVTLNLAVWCRIAAALGDAFGSRAVETPPHDWEAFLLFGVALQERGTLTTLLIGDQHLMLTLDETVISFTAVTSVLPGRAALADMVGEAVTINQVGHTSYLVRSQIDVRQVVRVTAAGTRTPHTIAQGVLSAIALGPAGLSLNVGTNRVTFTGLVQPRTKQYRVYGTNGRPVYVHRNGLAV